MCTAEVPAQSATDASRAGDGIEEIVVVAHKWERPLAEIAANVTIIDRDDIDAVLATSISDVLRFTPGIDAEGAGTRFGAEGVNVRGIGGNRVAILVDGVPLSDQFDIGSFSNATRDLLNTGLIDRIEILHGPASALFGSAAIGGVVAARTPDPSRLAGAAGTGGSVSTIWRGADESAHINGLYAFSSGATGFLFGGSLRSGAAPQPAARPAVEDFRDDERVAALAKVVIDDRNGGRWQLGLIRQHAEVRSELRSMLGSGRFRSTTALRGNDDYLLESAQLSYEFDTTGGFVDDGIVRAFHVTADTRQQTLDERALARTPVSIDRYFRFEQRIKGLEFNVQKRVGAGNALHRLGAGVEFRVRDTREYRDGLSTNLGDGSSTNVILGEEFPLRDFPLSESAEWGLYVEDAISLGALTLIAGVRADRYELDPRLDPMYAADYPFAELVAIDVSDLSPKLGLVYRFGNGADAYLQYAHGFRAPPYADANIGLEIPVFNFRAVPNPDLKSESSDGVEAGLRWRSARATLNVALFRTRYTDFIESKVRIGIDPDSGRLLFQSQNIASTVIEGIELSGGITFGGRFSGLALDATLYKARGRNRVNGEALNSVGPGQAVLGISMTNAGESRRLRLQTVLTEAWDERDESGGELFKPPGNAIVDLVFQQALSDRTTFRAGLYNLGDRSYWNWSEIRGLAPGDPVLPQLAGPGRYLALGIGFDW